MEAIARAHRIGQKNKVMVYQFVSRHTIEEGILEKSKQKLVLEHLVVKKMKQGVDQKELNGILRIGAQKLFDDGEGNRDATCVDVVDKKEDAIVYDDEAVDKLLDRNQESNIDRGDDPNNELLGEFNLAQVRNKIISLIY